MECLWSSRKCEKRSCGLINVQRSPDRVKASSAKECCATRRNSDVGPSPPVAPRIDNFVTCFTPALLAAKKNSATSSANVAPVGPAKNIVSHPINAGAQLSLSPRSKATMSAPAVAIDSSLVVSRAPRRTLAPALSSLSATRIPMSSVAPRIKTDGVGSSSSSPGVSRASVDRLAATVAVSLANAMASLTVSTPSRTLIMMAMASSLEISAVSSGRSYLAGLNADDCSTTMPASRKPFIHSAFVSESFAVNVYHLSLSLLKILNA
mmetsp:Transcript_27052/g.81088  ORF Transcript_27052/g.81088 Transcript_27052/m.81088 type:complete len:265 (-) Transcript_27052:344-1138(-)